MPDIRKKVVTEMDMERAYGLIKKLAGKTRNFVFLGEAGCGKSEIAINLACVLASCSGRQVHFFDLDMTKPLFRSRDQAGFLEEKGVHVHFEEQFYDAPTLVGGVSRYLRDDSCLTVLDVGGDHIGARSVGGYAPLLNQADTVVWYVVNPYRPWSMDIDNIDKTLSQILGVSHVQLARLRILGNPNVGPDTTAEEILEGARRLEEMISPYKAVEFYTVRESLCAEIKSKLPAPVFPLRLALTYEWLQEGNII